MVFKIILIIILFIAFISVMYGWFEGIIEKDDKLTAICSLVSKLIGFLLGFSLGCIIFNI